MKQTAKLAPFYLWYVVDLRNLKVALCLDFVLRGSFLSKGSTLLPSSVPNKVCHWQLSPSYVVVREVNKMARVLTSYFYYNSNQNLAWMPYRKMYTIKVLSKWALMITAKFTSRITPKDLFKTYWSPSPQ